MNENLKKIISEIEKSTISNSADELDTLTNSALMENLNSSDQIFQIAISCAENGRLPEALIIFNRLWLTIKNDPAIPFNLGVLYGFDGDWENALIFYNFAIQIKPDYLEAMLNKGSILHEQGSYIEALEQYQKVLFLSPNFVEGICNKGNTLYELRLYKEAINHFDRALSFQPDYLEAWVNKGNALYELGHYQEAIDHFDQALGLQPDYIEAWVNKGNVLKRLNSHDDAIKHFDKAIELQEDFPEAWLNKGNALYEQGYFDVAIKNFDKAILLKSNYYEALWNKSLILLLHGNFEEGLKLYESRWGSKKVSQIIGNRIFNQPTWLGLDPLFGKTILLYGEQGLGDFIQFCRYTKLLSDLGATVLLEVPLPLAGLLDELPGISQILVRGEDLPYFDYQCPVVSLPLAFKTNLNSIPAMDSYIKIDKKTSMFCEWTNRLGKKIRPRIGLAWSGNPHHKNDFNRSLLLQELLPFLPSQFDYVCLQKELSEVDKVILATNPKIRCFTDHIHCFQDTAALIENLDLIISVDTSVAHLSGALGKKTWILLPFIPDWRWLLDREDSPWYPSVKLYRQKLKGNWGDLLSQVKADLILQWTH